MAAAHPSNPIPAMTTYLPLDRPVVVIGSEFLAQYPVDLTLSEKAWTFGENDFKVMDFNGVLIFEVKSKHFSMHDRRFMKNAAGQTMVSLKQKIRTVHRRWEAFRGESTDDKDLIFSARKSSVLRFKTQLDVFLAGNKAEQVPDFRVKGSWAESSCTVFLGDTNTIIAQMYRKHNFKTAMLDTDCYNVTVYPNVDYAFVIALIVVLDEINADRSRGGASLVPAAAAAPPDVPNFSALV